MDKNNVNLKDIIWAFGVKEVDGKKVCLAIPYVKEVSVKGYEDLIDLTNSWFSAYKGKVTKTDIERKFESNHKAKILNLLSSRSAVENYLLNHDNIFNTEIEGIYSGIKKGEDAIVVYCDKKFLTVEEGSNMIDEMTKGFKISYKQVQNLSNYNI